MIAHITRVASLSPHLLRDMGFSEVMDQSSPDTQTLRKGPVTVTIQSNAFGTDPIITVIHDSDDPIDKT